MLAICRTSKQPQGLIALSSLHSSLQQFAARLAFLKHTIGIHGCKVGNGSPSKHKTLRAPPSGPYLGQSCSLVNMWTM